MEAREGTASTADDATTRSSVLLPRLLSLSEAKAALTAFLRSVPSTVSSDDLRDICECMEQYSRLHAQVMIAADMEGLNPETARRIVQDIKRKVREEKKSGSSGNNNMLSI